MIEDRPIYCDEVGEREWILQRFPSKCFFYPLRDCPGWRIGHKCARNQLEIPEIKELPE